MQVSQHAVPGPRLTTLAFPSQVDSLFALLVLAALMLPVNIGVYFYELNQFGEPRASLLSEMPPGGAWALHTLEPPVSGPSTKPATNKRDLDLRVSPALIAQSALLFRLVLTIAAFPAAVMIVAVGFYLKYPQHLRRQKRLRKADSDGSEKWLVDSVDRLAAVAGVYPTPTLEIADQQIRSSAAQVFGIGSHLSIMLSKGLCLDHLKHEARFEPVVCHELGHIANRDIGKTYFAEAVWRAFILITVSAWAAVVFAIAVREGRSSAGKILELLGAGIEGWGTVLAVQAIRAKLLRAREYGADARAVSMGAGASLCDQFRAAAAPILKWPGFRRYWQLHPTPSQRLAAVENPRRHFLASNGLSLAIGFLLPSICPGLFCILLVWVSALIEGILKLGSPLAARFPDGSRIQTVDQKTAVEILGTMAIVGFAVAFVPLMAAVLWIPYRVAQFYGLAIFRGVSARLAFGDQNAGKYGRLWVEAIVFTLGVVMGYVFAPLSSAAQRSYATVELIAFVPLCLLSMGCCLSYLRFFSAVIIKRHIGPDFPTAKFRLLTFGACMQLAGMPGLFFVVWSPSLGEQSARSTEGMLIAGAMLSCLAYPCIFALTAITLLLWSKLHPLRCPSCLAISQQTISFGNDCQMCGEPLAAWSATIDSYVPVRLRSRPFGSLTQPGYESTVDPLVSSPTLTPLLSAPAIPAAPAMPPLPAIPPGGGVPVTPVPPSPPPPQLNAAISKKVSVRHGA